MGSISTFQRRAFSESHSLICYNLFFKGVSQTIKLFSRKYFLKGIIAFFGGIIFVVCRWGLFGMTLQIFGMIHLFGQFLPIVSQSLQSVPVIGTVFQKLAISRFLNSFGGSSRFKTSASVGIFYYVWKNYT